MDFRQSTRNKKLEHWVLVILVFSLCIGLNFFVSKINWQLDLSNETKYSLSEESIALLNKLEAPIEIIVTIKDDKNLPKIAQKFMHDIKLLLGAFENAPSSELIRSTFLDIESPKPLPQYLSEYTINEPNLIIIASPNGGQKTIFRYDPEVASNPYDDSTPFRSRDSAARQALLETDFYSDWKESFNGVLEPTKFRGEENFIRAMLALAGRKNSRNTAFFTTGHGEKSPFDLDELNGYSEFSRILEDRNIKVATIDLSLGEKIPDNAFMIVVAGPKGTFQDKEVSSIQSFLNNNGKLLLAIDPVEELSVLDRPAFGLRPILKEWGLRCHDMLVYDNSPENYDIFTGAYILRTYREGNNHRIVSQHTELGLSIQTDRCRPIETIDNDKIDFDTSELIYTSQNSLGLSGWTQRKTPPVKNPLLDLEGRIPIIAASEKRKENKNQHFTKGKIIALGSSSILANKYLTKHSGNNLLGKNFIYWLNESPDMLEIPPRNIEYFSVSMQESDFDNLLYSISIVPITIAFIGIFVGWLRKEL